MKMALLSSTLISMEDVSGSELDNDIGNDKIPEDSSSDADGSYSSKTAHQMMTNPCTLLCGCAGKLNDFLYDAVTQPKQYAVTVSPRPAGAPWNGEMKLFTGFANGVFTLPNLPAQFIHDVAYTVTLDFDGFQLLVANNVKLADCDVTKGSFYAVPNTSLCLPCPQYANCNGTTTLVTRSNVWRPSTSTSTFLQCDGTTQACLIPFVNETNDDQVEAEDRVGYECKEGYTGVLCSVCADGYGKTGSQCAKCLPPEGTVLVTIVIGVVVWAVLTWMSISSAPEAPKKRKQTLPDNEPTTEEETKKTQPETESEHKTAEEGAESTATPDAPTLAQKLRRVQPIIQRIFKLGMTWSFCVGVLAETLAARRATNFVKRI
eukprot:PhF_6_TR13410/c3_g1_i1/m.21343